MEEGKEIIDFIESMGNTYGFKSIPNNPEEELDSAYRRDNIIIGRYRVMFGYRLRAGYVGEFTYYLDICCGPAFITYLNLLDKIMAIIDYNLKQNWDAFKGIPPMSRIKPFPLDDEFLDEIEALHNTAIGK